jgi:hypothetical protein
MSEKKTETKLRFFHPVKGEKGISICDHGNGTSTTMYHNNGHKFERYIHPNKISFKSPMVNKHNQHYCGGWHHP